MAWIYYNPNKHRDDAGDCTIRAITVTGNPEEKVQELLNNGTMTQQQYNMLYGLAKKITKM